MDKLKECAEAYEKLLGVEYHIQVGRKEKLYSINLSFKKENFVHLTGLHKLKDLGIHTIKREYVFDDIMNGQITVEDIMRSSFYPEMQPRLEPFIQIESLLDSNNNVFLYSEKRNNFSLIKAEYVLKNEFENNVVYIFLDKNEREPGHFCRTFFPKSKQDYTINQARCALLYKEKIDINTNTKTIQFNRLA